MSRVVAVPTMSRSAALITSGIGGLVVAQLLIALALVLAESPTTVSPYGEPASASTGATLVAVLGTLLMLSGGSALLLGVYRAVANVDRYLAFRVAVQPRRIDQAAPVVSLPGGSPTGYVPSPLG